MSYLEPENAIDHRSHARNRSKVNIGRAYPAGSEMNIHPTPAILIISGMITPALLILALGSLVNTTLQRLARTVDRIRVLLALDEESKRRQRVTQELLDCWLARYASRAILAQGAVTGFIAAIAVFVADGLAVAIDFFAGNTLTWLPVGLTVLGMFTMLFAAFLMLGESRLASVQIREEISLATNKQTAL